MFYNSVNPAVATSESSVADMSRTKENGCCSTRPFVVLFPYIQWQCFFNYTVKGVQDEISKALQQIGPLQNDKTVCFNIFSCPYSDLSWTFSPF